MLTLLMFELLFFILCRILNTIFTSAELTEMWKNKKTEEDFVLKNFPISVIVLDDNLLNWSV